MEKKLTEQQESFLGFLFEEAQGNIRSAMDLAGYSKSYRASNLIRSLKQEILDLTKEYLASQAPIAAMKQVSILFDPNQTGTTNLLKAAQDILNRANISAPKDGLELLVPTGGLVILPAKGFIPHNEIENEKE